MNTDIWLYAGLIAGALSIFTAVFSYIRVRQYDAGSDRAQQIA